MHRQLRLRELRILEYMNLVGAADDISPQIKNDTDNEKRDLQHKFDALAAKRKRRV